jgi:hypothetical protein
MVLFTCAEKSLRRKAWVAKFGATLSTLADHRIGNRANTTVVQEMRH